MRAPLAFPLVNRVIPPTPTNPVRRLTLEEMQWRRAQNLCFDTNTYVGGL
jgi:hypothetical protein